jgi:hypothetical protein
VPHSGFQCSDGVFRETDFATRSARDAKRQPPRTALPGWKPISTSMTT